MRFPLRLAALICIVSIAAARAQWTVDLQKDATPTLRFDGIRALSMKYAAWGPQWKFATLRTAPGKTAAHVTPFTGDCTDLNLKIRGTITVADDKLIYDWAITCTKSSSGNIGGALAHDFRLDPAVFDTPSVGKPEIAGDGKGWTWTPVDGQTLTATFDMPGKCTFERGDPSNLRAWMIPAALTPGEMKMRMTIAFPAGTKLNDQPPKPKYAEFDPKRWLPDTLDWRTSPIDLSSLNDKPAGRRGFVKASGDKLVFDDGTQAKFWGCNVAAYALFSEASDAAIEQQAKRIAALGYNLVRIHHHDSAAWSPSVFVKNAANTQALDPAALDRIDYWVKCLKDQGVYVWLDLHIGRPFKEGDAIDGYGELPLAGKAGRFGIGFNYVNPRITQLMKDLAKAYLTRINKYTGLKYTDEPAVMGVLITNENDITDHFGNAFLPDKPSPIHRQWFTALRDKIVGERGLDASKAWQTWMPGPSKVVLNDIQYQWSKDFVDYLHVLGVKVPIATTNTWGNDPLFSLPALTAGDVIDVHAYGVPEPFSGNPKADANLAMWIAAGQVLGKPLTVTEWNIPFPAKDRFTAPMYIAAEAGLQGWDAPMIFGYQQSPLVSPAKLTDWSTSNDPAITALMPAAALMFRRGDVAEAQTTAVVTLTGEQLLMQDVSPKTSRALRTVAEQHKLTIAMPQTPLLPWLKPSEIPDGAMKINDLSMNALPPGATAVVSDTGQLVRDWSANTFSINTPRTQSASGFLPPAGVSLGDVTIKLTMPKATVVVSSLDNEPIATSKKMLLTVAAQANGTGKPGAPVLAEPVTGSVTFKNPIAGAAVLTPQGDAGATLKISGDTLELPGNERTHWFLLTR